MLLELPWKEHRKSFLAAILMLKNKKYLGILMFFG